MSGSRQARGVKVEVDGSMVSRVLKSRQESKQVNRSEQKKKKTLYQRERWHKGARREYDSACLNRGSFAEEERVMLSARRLLVVQAG